MNLAVPHLQPDPIGAPVGQPWRFELRRQLAALRDQLAGETSAAYGGWLAAREERGLRERTLLLRRIGAIGQVVQAAPEPVARAEVDRLAADVARHHRRARALARDAVQLELGGSE